MPIAPNRNQKTKAKITEKERGNIAEDDVKKQEEMESFFSVTSSSVSLVCESYERRRNEEELSVEISSTKIHVQQSKIREDCIPNLPNFPT